MITDKQELASSNYFYYPSVFDPRCESGKTYCFGRKDIYLRLVIARSNHPFTAMFLFRENSRNLESDHKYSGLSKAHSSTVICGVYLFRVVF